jgi:hypothetical protein
MPQIKVLLLLLVACACSARAQDAMSLPGSCSGEPPAWSGPAARVPEVETPRRGSATLLGTVSDRSTDRPLRGGSVRAWGAGAPANSEPREAIVDSLGGFALRDLPPDKYEVQARMVGYRYSERTVRLEMGRVDTLVIVLPYYSCSGY